MNYETFLNEIERTLIDTLPKGSSLHRFRAHQNNGGTLDGLGVFTPDTTQGPAIYLNSFYEAHKKGVSLTHILTEIQYLLEEYRRVPFPLQVDISDFNSIKSRIVCKLIHQTSNRELLKEVPNRPFLDLAVVCYLYLGDTEAGNASVTIQYAHLALWNLTEEELFSLAFQNTPNILPSEERNIEDMMAELIPELPPLPPSYPMYVLTNCKRYFGAATLLYPDILQDFATRMNTDFYVLPSSIHEVILLPAENHMSMEALGTMVNEINAEAVPPADWLSNHVYYYNREKESLLY